MTKMKIPSETLKLEREFEVVIELDEDGIYVASISELEGCHTQAKSMNELRERISEAAVLYLGSMSGRLKSLGGIQEPKIMKHVELILSLPSVDLGQLL